MAAKAASGSKPHKVITPSRKACLAFRLFFYTIVTHCSPTALQINPGGVNDFIFIELNS
jgi:hypothetical protein